MSELEEKWNDRYRGLGIEDGQPARVLVENRHLLPRKGDALDLACGLGANGLLLARHGLKTVAWDLSDVVVKRLQAYAEQRKLPLRAEQRDIERRPPSCDSYDVIVVSRYLERQLVPHLIASLRKGGLLFYQTFIRDSVENTGPSNPVYRLETNELLQLFSGLRLVVYREEGTIGDVKQGFRNEAMLVAVKASPHFSPVRAKLA